MKNEKTIKNLIVFVFFTLVLMVPLIHYPLRGELLVDSFDGRTIRSLSFITRSIFNGDFPIWNKYLENGMPSIGSNTLFNIPAMVLGWLPLQWFVFFLYCLHVSCAAFFMYLYLQQIKCSRTAAFAVAIMILFSIHLGGYRKSHIYIICATALFPAVMYFMQCCLNTNKMKYLAFASGVLAFAFSYAQTQHVVYMAIASGIYLVIISIHEKVKLSVLIKRVAVFSLLFFVFAAVVLFPSIEIIMEYTKNGSVNAPYDFFKDGSITPLSLIYMLFPRFYNNIFQNNGYFPFSEMEIEFFIGVTAICVLLFAFKYYLRQNFQMMISLGMCIIVFIYMSIGFVPILRNIVFRMPIFGNFRFPSRMLFVFLFFIYSIIGLCLTKFKDKEDAAIFFKFQRRFTVFILMFICLILFVLIAVINLLGGSELGNHSKGVIEFGKRALMPTGIILISGSLIFLYIDKFFIFNKKWHYQVLIAVISLFVLIETVPFFLMTNSSPAVITTDEDKLTRRLSLNIGNGKIFDLFAGIDGAHISLISQNRSMDKCLPSINAYIAYNNPVLYRFISGEKRALFNFSGLLTGSLNATKNVFEQNDLLSMLGIKYLIDSSGIIPNEGFEVFDYTVEGRLLPLIHGQNFCLVQWGNDLQGYAEEVSIKPDTLYIAVFDYSTSLQEGVFSIDLYDTVSDSLVRKTLIPGKRHVEVLLYSGNSEKFIGNQYIRVFSYGSISNEIIEVSKFNLYEVEKNTKDTNMTYVPFIIDEQTRIFENANARDILYFSNEVKGIDNNEFIFEYQGNLNLDRISYIIDAHDEAFDLQESVIRDINFKNNTITGIVESKKGNFVNFSQNYFPGWRVYIDGKRAELKLVNALIMGVYVPPGIHKIKFSFVSISFILGAIITCLSVVGCITVFGIIPYYKRKKINKEK